MASKILDAEYTGVDNLAAMQEARNYNAYLISRVLEYGQGTHKWLDFGAGLGTYAEMLKNKTPHLDCLEPDSALASLLDSKGFRNFCDSKALADGSYDFIYSLNVFEHIEDDGAVAREVFRILAPGGKLFIYVPALQYLFGSMDRQVKHYRRYTRNSLEKLVSDAGFKVQSSRYADVLGVPVTLAFNVLSRNNGIISSNSVAAYDKLIFPVSKMADHLTSRFLGKNVFVVAEKR